MCHSKPEIAVTDKLVSTDPSNYYGIRIIYKGQDHFKCGACSHDFVGKCAYSNCRHHVFGVHLGKSFFLFFLRL